MLTKGLYAQKRKEKAPSGSSKRAKVGAPSYVVLAIPVTASEVAPSVEVPPIIEVGAAGVDSLPPASLSLPAGEQVLEPPNEREKGDEKKKKKLAILKIVRKARPGKPNDSGNDLREDPFDNLGLNRQITKYSPISKGRTTRRRKHRRPKRIFKLRSVVSKWRRSPSPLLTSIRCLSEFLYKSMVRNLKKEVHHLKKKMKKIEDKLQRSRKSASKAMIEVTRLQKLHMRDFVDFRIRKDSYDRELAELKKSVRDKSWALIAKIGSLEVQLKAAKEKIRLLGGSSPWSFDKMRYG
ncbi:hypothetical protein COCNU_12G000500 [Cocos nucifera]|uniref:Uncharacterized protein n=1 Tax=Cocos nucifera TaxID=13894 RepID=A0A8K0IQK8_COCNU|nr:hypothetical protein COCNU_12G000500 [Cocos nucifera]